MGLFDWLFGKSNRWKELTDRQIPGWILKRLSNSAYEVNYYSGKTFRYKGIKLPGEHQGHYIYRIFRKLRSHKIRKD